MRVAVTWSDLFGVPFEVLPALAAAGVDCVRLIAKGFSNSAELVSKLEDFRPTASAPGQLELMLDIPVQRPIVGQLCRGFVLEEGEEYRLMQAGSVAAARDIPVVGVGSLIGSIRSGDVLEIADGRILLEVRDIEPGALRCIARKGGELSPGRSIKGRAQGSYQLLPEALALLSDDLSVHGVRAIAISFVESPKLVHSVANLVQHWAERPRLVAKLESRGGVENTSLIGSACDAVMLARGDLSTLVTFGEFASRMAKFVEQLDETSTFCIATGVLTSLERNERPSISDMSDISHWLRLGAREFLFADFEHLEPTLRAAREFQKMLHERIS